MASALKHLNLEHRFASGLNSSMVRSCGPSSDPSLGPGVACLWFSNCETRRAKKAQVSQVKEMPPCDLRETNELDTRLHTREQISIEVLLCLIQIGYKGAQGA